MAKKKNTPEEELLEQTTDEQIQDTAESPEVTEDGAALEEMPLPDTTALDMGAPDCEILSADPEPILGERSDGYVYDRGEMV